LVSNSHKLLWVGINGTATTSMAPSLMKWKTKGSPLQPNQKHQTYVEARKFAEDKGYDINSFLKFSFVRNPWDRQVGRFFHDKKVGDIPKDVTFAQWIRWFDQRFKDKGGFLPAFKDPSARRAWCCAVGGSHKPKYLPRWDWPCFYWCCNEDMEIEMDFIGRIENIEEDFKKLSKLIGIDLELPHKNKSERGPYQDYYTKETRDIVEKIFEKDIEHFNYQY